MEGVISQIRLFYGALLALSVFSAMLLLWLGLTVVLNARRRTRALWLAGSGLLASSIFFVGHTMIVVQSVQALGPVLSTWWRLGWLALISAPFAWYLAVLWHTGYWEERDSSFRRCHRPLAVTVTVLAAALLVVFSAAKPLPYAVQLTGLYFFATPVVFGIPVLVLLYPLFVLLCVSFSLSALRRPGPVARAMQGPARERARPWLIGASLTLVSVGVFMVEVMLFLVVYGGRHSLEMMREQPVIEAYWLDLVVMIPTTAAVLLSGQAIVAYEIFTGETLPRRGLRRQWQNAIILAGGYSLVVGVGFAAELHAIYPTLVGSAFVAVTYALLGWRSFVERERYIAHLRPFVASEHAYDAILAASPVASPQASAGSSFGSLCREVLRARAAHLVATGSLAPLVERPLSHPDGLDPPADLSEVVARCNSPEVTVLPVDPDRHGGAAWAVPLRGPRGLVGVLLLGDKTDAGLYSQEEIEIARASGERLLDAISVANLARRLLALQRHRFAEAQVLDRESRRTLHDEILPSLHAAMLSLGAAPAGDRDRSGALARLGEVHKRISALLREMPIGGPSRVGRLGLLGALRNSLDTEFRRNFDEVAWHSAPAAEQRAAALPSLTADVVFYAAKEAVRNAARHGRGDRPDRALRLRIEAAWWDGLELCIEDDGVGTGSTMAPGGPAGQGLVLHSTMLAVVGGSLTVESRPQAGTSVRIFLPEQACADSVPQGVPPAPQERSR